MGKINFKRLGRRTKNTLKKVGTIVRKGAGVVRGIIGTVDKITGGKISRMVSNDPRAMLLMGGLDHIAEKHH